MPGAEAGREQTYQWLLRALGAILDREPSCRITLVELPEGFRVRLHHPITSPDPVGVMLHRDTLVEQIHALSETKGSTTRVGHESIWRHVATGHQDFFRAVGYELDDVHAQNVVIDELDDGLVLTYTYRDPTTSAWKKRMAILGINDIEAILRAAIGRRRTSHPAGSLPRAT